ncbi:carboxypeptidase-like regulatory domain-containing protein [Neolewinella maritima]|nr:carboxypeptidase-like regulatory domain-containing protein [Neolewinella maritima]
MAHTFEGRVIDQTGAPVAEVAVTILDGPGSFPDLASLTDSTGRFTLHELSAGTFTIYLMAPSGKSARRRISVGDRSGVVDVRLP